MLLFAAEAVRRHLRDARELVEPYRLAVGAAACITLSGTVLALFGLGAFMLGAGCLTVGVALGALAGFDFGRSQHIAPRRAAEREIERLRQELDAQTAANAGLRHLAEKYKTSAGLSCELAESHLAEVRRLRGEASHG